MGSQGIVVGGRFALLDLSILFLALRVELARHPPQGHESNQRIAELNLAEVELAPTTTRAPCVDAGHATFLLPSMTERKPARLHGLMHPASCYRRSKVWPSPPPLSTLELVPLTTSTDAAPSCPPTTPPTPTRSSRSLTQSASSFIAIEKIDATSARTRTTVRLSSSLPCIEPRETGGGADLCLGPLPPSFATGSVWPCDMTAAKLELRIASVFEQTYANGLHWEPGLEEAGGMKEVLSASSVDGPPRAVDLGISAFVSLPPPLA